MARRAQRPRGGHLAARGGGDRALVRAERDRVHRAGQGAGTGGALRRRRAGSAEAVHAVCQGARGE